MVAKEKQVAARALVLPLLEHLHVDDGSLHLGRRLQLPLRFLPLALALLSVGLGRRCVEGGVGGTEMLDGQALQVARSASLCRAAVGRGVAVRVERGASLKSDSSTVLREDLRVRAYSVRRTHTQSRDRAFVLLVRGVAVV